MTIFLDVDGVLADYYGGVCRLANVEPWPYKCPVGDWDFHIHPPIKLSAIELARHMGRDFYASLKLLPDARKIVARAEEIAGKDNVVFLTAPWDTPGCEEGKRIWVKTHFPDYAVSMFIGKNKHKLSHPQAMLWDDSPINVRWFTEKGGKGFLVPRPWNTGHALSSLEDGMVENLDVGLSISMMLNKVDW